MRALTSAFLLLACCSLLGCEPRGESRSLDEIVAIERQAFHEAAGSSSCTPVLKERLDKLVVIIDRIPLRAESGPGAEYVEVADKLSDLIPQAGFTVRPSLGELVGEFRGFRGHAGEDYAARWKLLLARTYSVLAQTALTSPGSL